MPVGLVRPVACAPGAAKYASIGRIRRVWPRKVRKTDVSGASRGSDTRPAQCGCLADSAQIAGLWGCHEHAASDAGWMSRSMEALISLIEELGGVVRTTKLIEYGFGRRMLDAARERDALTRPRRGWVASKRADPLLVHAARHGVVLTCRTQARRLGLWLHDPDGPPHVAVSPNAAGGRRLKVKTHWGAPVVPRHPDALVDGIENVLAYVAECEPYEHGLATWESALNQSLVTVEALKGFAWRPAARRILANALPFADAGLETYLRERLRWLRVPIRVQVWIAGHRVDTLIGDRLILQIDGAHHVGAQRTEDIRHDAELMLRGYHVIRLSYTHVMFDWPRVQEMIMRAVAQGLHRPR